MYVLRKSTTGSDKWNGVQQDMQKYTHNTTKGHTKRPDAAHAANASASARAESCPHTKAPWHRETNQNVTVQSHIKLALKHILGSAGPSSVKLANVGVKYLQIMFLGICLFPLQNLKNITPCKLVCAQEEIELAHLNAPLAIMQRGSKGTKWGGNMVWPL